jgi:Protein of unknown function (DUF1570)
MMGRTREDSVGGDQEWPHRATSDLMDRREWLRIASATAAGLAGVGGTVRASAGPELAADEAGELERAEDKARRVTNRPISTLKSAHYQAIGDASTTFIKLTLSDCEQMASEFLAHFRSKGFEVELPDRRMTVIAFRDERPFVKLAEGAPPGTMGFFSLSSNWLALFDFRNVPMNPNAAGQTNMETLTHEATHQLSFNTGLLAREADYPRSIVEGLAMYCERRRLFDRSGPGQLNLRRLDEMAHIRRREPWVDASVLLTDDRACFQRTGDRMLLSYAEGWLMVYHLMSDPIRLPQFRTYLEARRVRREPRSRLEDAKTHFGDLAALDRELRQEGIRLQRGR